MPRRPAPYRPTADRPRPREHRESACKRGYGRDWQKLRLSHLQQNPWCVRCEQDGRVTAAAQVDHTIPHKGDPALFWDPDNLQSLCETCHSRKTAVEDGGFGRPPRTPQDRRNPAGVTPPDAAADRPAEGHGGAAAGDSGGGNGGHFVAPFLR
jgi:5-methylcytosine-specific restriction enzyme A